VTRRIEEDASRHRRPSFVAELAQPRFPDVDARVVDLDLPLLSGPSGVHFAGRLQGRIGESGDGREVLPCLALPLLRLQTAADPEGESAPAHARDVDPPAEQMHQADRRASFVQGEHPFRGRVPIADHQTRDVNATGPERDGAVVFQMCLLGAIVDDVP
jgi:hypothetical protein